MKEDNIFKLEYMGIYVCIISVNVAFIFIAMILIGLVNFLKG